jgi:hypothetical protein
MVICPPTHTLLREVSNPGTESGIMSVEEFIWMYINCELVFIVTSDIKGVFFLHIIILKDFVLKYFTCGFVCVTEQYYYNFQINITLSSWMMNLMIRVGMETWEMER